MRVGQVWEEKDRRAAGRLIKVCLIDKGLGRALVRSNKRDALLKIRLDRFGTDYRLVQEAPQ